MMCMLMTIHIAAQTYGRSIARTFFDNVEKWVVSNRYADRKAIVKSCGDGMRVNDELMQRLAEKNDDIPMGEDGYELNDYLNCLKNEMDKKPRNFHISFGNIQEIPQNKLPKDNKGCSLYTFTVRTSGSINFVCEDVLLVRKGKICGIAKYIEDKDHRIHIDFDDFLNDYEGIGFSYNYGKYFPVGGSFNYSFADIPFMLSVDFGVNLDGDKYIIDEVEMKDIVNYDRKTKILDPKFFLTVTPQFYMKYFALGCGVGVLWMDGKENTAHYSYTTTTGSSSSATISGGNTTEGNPAILLKPMIRPVAKAFIPLSSDELFLSVSVGYDLIFGYKEKNGINFGLGVHWEY